MPDRHPVYTGSARYYDASTFPTRGDDVEWMEGALTIVRGVQSRFNLVQIDGLGEGKTSFAANGDFRGTWAFGDRIYNVSGRARGNRTDWHGDFELRAVHGTQHILKGTFVAQLQT